MSMVALKPVCLEKKPPIFTVVALWGRAWIKSYLGNQCIYNAKNYEPSWRIKTNQRNEVVRKLLNGSVSNLQEKKMLHSETNADEK